MDTSFCCFGRIAIELSDFVRLLIDNSNFLLVEVILYSLERWTFHRELNIVSRKALIVLVGGSERIIRIMVTFL